MLVKLDIVRGAFLNVFTPRPFGDSKELRYSGAFPIVPGSENAKKLDAAIAAVAAEEFGKTAAATLQDLREKRKVCFVHGPAKDEAGEIYQGFEGMFTLNAGQAEKKGKPLCISRNAIAPDQQEEGRRYTDSKHHPKGLTFLILEEKDGKPYSGCYVNVTVDIWAQNNQYGKRINAQLKTLQFVKDGDAFGGGAPARPNEFEDLGVPEEEESLV